MKIIVVGFKITQPIIKIYVFILCSDILIDIRMNTWIYIYIYINFVMIKYENIKKNLKENENKIF